MLIKTIEIRVRAFLTCDEASIAPSTTVMVDVENIAKVQWADLLRKQVELLEYQFECSPFSNLRTMTDQETENYLAEENAENVIAVR